jgi:hypothetical protein
MSKWIVTEYESLPLDKYGVPVPISRKAIASRKFVAATSPVALDGKTRFVRFCGDTAAHVKADVNATDNDEYVAAGADYWLAPDGAVISFIVG